MHGAPQERAREGDLLLVSARQRLRGLLDRRHPDAEPAHEIENGSPLAPAAENAQPAVALQNLDRRVRTNAEHGKQRLPGPVAAEEHHAGFERADRRPRVQSAAVAAHGARRAARRPRRTAGTAPGRCPRRPAMPRISPLRTWRSIGPNRSPWSPVTSRQTSLGTERIPIGKGLSERPADHQRDEGVLRHPGCVEGALADAVPQHGDPVGDSEHLRKPVAHVHHADSGAAALEHERVELLDLLGPERGRGLVQKQYPRLGEEGLHDLEQLPLGERQAARRQRRPGPQPELLELARRPGLHVAEGGALARWAPRDTGSRPRTSRGPASRSGTPCPGRGVWPPPRRPSRAGARRSRPCPRRARGTRWRSRATSTSPTRSPRRARGSRLPGSRRSPRARPGPRRRPWRRHAARGRRGSPVQELSRGRPAQPGGPDRSNGIRDLSRRHACPLEIRCSSVGVYVVSIPPDTSSRRARPG